MSEKWNGGKVRGYKVGSTAKGSSGSQRPGQGYQTPKLAEDSVGATHYAKKGKTPKPAANPFAVKSKRGMPKASTKRKK